MSAPHRIVIVGNGMAGARLAEDVLVRRSARAFSLVMFGDEPRGNYNRILLSGVLAGTHREDDIVTHPREWYATHGVTLHAGVRVTRVDLAARVVFADNGRCEPYDSLVFATGSRAFLPPIDGLQTEAGQLKAGAFVFRTIDDCRNMIAHASRARTAVVVGGGLLGLEAARGLSNHGLDVHVVHLTAHVMDAQLDPAGSRILHKQLEGMGIGVLPGRTTTGILGGTAVSGVQFSDGTTQSCDMLVVAAGIRPSTELAEQAGLAVRHGIIVGDDLACSGADGVYAIGECAEHRGRVYGLVAPAWEQADVLADRLTGRRPVAVYEGSRLTTKLKVAGLDVAVMGEKDEGEDGEVVSYTEPSRGIYKKLILRGDRLVGVMLIGGGAIVPTLMQAFLDGAALPAERSDLLFPPLIDPPVRDVSQIPETARICDCNAVTKGQIVEAVFKGARSLRSVCERTRAGTGCGSCRPEVQRIVDAACEELDESETAHGQTAADAALLTL